MIDGESTDGTVEFLEENTITYTSEKDLGIYDAMNTAISKATGHYLLFMNAGDFLATPKTLEFLKPHTDKKSDFIYGDALEPRENENKPRLQNRPEHR